MSVFKVLHILYSVDLLIACVEKSFLIVIALRSYVQRFIAGRQSNVSLHCYIPYTQFSVFFPHYPFCLDIRSYLFASKSHRITTTHRSSAKSVSASCLRAVIIQRTEKSKNICFEKKREKSVILFLNLQLSRLNVNKMC